MCERNDVARGLRLQSGGTAPEGGVMDWNEAKSRWQAHRGDLARRWPRISERDIDAIAGDRDQLSQRIQAIYGISAREADRQISEWEHQQPPDEPGVTEDDAVPGAGGNPSVQASQHGYMDDEDQREMNESTPSGGSSQNRAASVRRK
jgi:uncharacterized protein YjbJ (UPF0337 family)